MPPWTLSDPYLDFAGMEDELLAIAAKQGVGLTGEELAFTVFAGYLPAGNYEECCNYLPAAYEYLRSAVADGDDCLEELWEHLFHIWVPEHIDELRRDDRLVSVLTALRGIFQRRLNDWLAAGNSSAAAATMTEWCIVYLCSALVADEHQALLEKLLHGGVHARMLFLALHPVSEPFFPMMSESNAACYCSEAAVHARIRQLRPDSTMRSFLGLLRSDVLEWRMENYTRQELCEYWMRVLKYAAANLP